MFGEELKRVKEGGGTSLPAHLESSPSPQACTPCRLQQLEEGRQPGYKDGLLLVSEASGNTGDREGPISSLWKHPGKLSSSLRVRAFRTMMDSMSCGEKSQRDSLSHV